MSSHFAENHHCCLDICGFSGVLGKCCKRVGHLEQCPANTEELHQEQRALARKRTTDTGFYLTFIYLGKSPWDYNMWLICDWASWRWDLGLMFSGVTCSLPPRLRLHPTWWVQDCLHEGPSRIASYTQPSMAQSGYSPRPTLLEFKVSTKRRAGPALRHCCKKNPTELFQIPQSPKKKRLLLFPSDSDSDDRVGPNCALSFYRADSIISETDRPLKWWSNHAGAHSQLSVLVQKYLASSATSVPCERVFLLAEIIIQKKRAALSSENVNMLVCLSNWFKERK